MERGLILVGITFDDDEKVEAAVVPLVQEFARVCRQGLAR